MLLKKGNLYPLYIGDLQLEYPSWEDGMSLPVGWQAVQETDPPLHRPGTVLKESSPQYVNGAWLQSWEEVALSSSDIAKMQSGDEEIAKKYSLFQNPEL